MNNWMVTYNSSDLMHHGIKGQRWGIRRYQNYDGTYTQAGLKRYNETFEKYVEAKRRYKENKTSENKAEYKRLKKLEKRDYKQLEKDYRADEGKKLYNEGKTVREYTKKQNIRNLITAGAGATLLASETARVQNKNISFSWHGKKLTTLDDIISTVAAGVMGASIAKNMKDEEKKKNLRAYYSHSRPKK